MGRIYDLVISEEASEEIEAIRDFNERRKKGLGSEYLVDILDCLERIQQNLSIFNITARLKMVSEGD